MNYNENMLQQLGINAIAFFVTSYIVPGMAISGWQALIVASVIWGILTLFIRPILILLTLPINILTLGLFTFVINALLLQLLGKIVPGFEIANFTTALIASIILALVHVFLTKLANKNKQ